MLPEHKEQLLQRNREVNKKVKPTFDEQRIEEIIRVVAVAVFTEREVIAIIYGDYEDRVIIGKIDEKIDSINKRIKIVNDEGYEWIRLEDVIDLDINT
jgi:hypothetical protein